MINKLDQPGGHILVCVFLLLVFVAIQILGYQWAHDEVEMALGAVYLAINVKRPGAQQ